MDLFIFCENALTTFLTKNESFCSDFQNNCNTVVGVTGCGQHRPARDRDLTSRTSRTEAKQLLQPASRRGPNCWRGALVAGKGLHVFSPSVANNANWQVRRSYCLLILSRIFCPSGAPDIVLRKTTLRSRIVRTSAADSGSSSTVKSDST